MSDFIFLYRMEGRSAEPDEMRRRMDHWMAWMKDLSDRGYIKDYGQPLELGGKVLQGGERTTVLDGPYAETKDLVCGFTIVEARDLDHAAELAGGCPVLAGGGMVEVRPVLKLRD
ncbi:hypothetical protein CCAX7_48040 [Capsulimonas corticalis]|uniref:Uncharacterized protein n=1 Tax=Capsulimonas corticalis TaxID=2219043 RepID=A0A402CQ33_9BACT|nr:YciI family protein [Capsulimonas corticalis]BDI32753.1 hypothetical protein CCAX7_48040 [Capsulimonas corticalis]